MKKQIFKIMITSIVACTVFISNDGLITKADGHVHNANCYESAVHTHQGIPNIKGGCYQGNQQRIICNGTGTIIGTVLIPTSNNTYVLEGRYLCQKCGCNFIRGTSNKEYGNEMQVTDEIRNTYMSLYPAAVHSSEYVYTLSCGKTEGTVYKSNIHIHVGKPTVQSGCYKGSSSTKTCYGTCNYTAYGKTTSTCGNCGNFGRYEEYTCSSCGMIIRYEGFNCCSFVYFPDSSFTHGTYSVFALNCGFTDGEYETCNGAKASMICNKWIQSITSKNSVQTIYR